MKRLLVVIFQAISISLFGTTYYVATNGNDNNPGTITQPFATWQKGFNVAVAGDVVNIRGGIYYSSASASIAVEVSDKNGTSNNRITIRAYEGEVPVLDCSGMSANAARRGISMSNCSYYTLIGLTVRNVKEYGQ